MFCEIVIPSPELFWGCFPQHIKSTSWEALPFKSCSLLCQTLQEVLTQGASPEVWGLALRQSGSQTAPSVPVKWPCPVPRVAFVSVLTCPTHLVKINTGWQAGSVGCRPWLFFAGFWAGSMLWVSSEPCYHWIQPSIVTALGKLLAYLDLIYLIFNPGGWMSPFPLQPFAWIPGWICLHLPWLQRELLQGSRNMRSVLWAWHMQILHKASSWPESCWLDPQSALLLWTLRGKGGTGGRGFGINLQPGFGDRCLPLFNVSNLFLSQVSHHSLSWPWTKSL